MSIVLSGRQFRRSWGLSWQQRRWTRIFARALVVGDVKMLRARLVLVLKGYGALVRSIGLDLYMSQTLQTIETI